MEKPKNWQSVKFNELFEFKNGINADKSSYGEGGVKFINVMEIIYNNYITIDMIPGAVKIREDQKKLYSVQNGDVLFNRTSETTEEIGLSAVYYGAEEVVFGGFVIRGRSKGNQIDNDFKKYCFKSDYIRKQIIVRGQGAVRSNIGQGDLQTVRIILPPLPEQQKIASILSKWDELIETQTQLIVEKEKQKKGLMQKLLTGEVRFPGFEEEWEEVELGEVAEFSNGKAHENIVDENGKYILITSKFISTDGAVYRSLNDRLTPLYKNDIVMVMSDVPNGKAIAKCYLVEKDNLYSLNQRIGRFVFNDHDPRFMFYLLNRNPYFLAFDSGVGQTNLRKDDILECPLLLPSIPEQKKISSTLNAIDEEIQSLYDKLEAIKLQKKGLMQQLLTGEIRVKV